MRKVIIIIYLIAIFISLQCCSSKEPQIGLKEQVVEHTLSNGMRWFLVKRGYAPIFTGVVQVKVGGADEVLGKTGLAHFLEHMAFKGTSTLGTTDYNEEKKIIAKIDKLVAEGGDSSDISKLLEEQRKYMVPNEIWDLFIRNGASDLNAYTSKDVTTYHASMPNSKLELWIYLNSELITDPAFREFYPERNVVLEELRSSIDNNPNGKLFESVLETTFEKSPYRWPVIGLKEDVANLTRSDLQEFYKNHYQPECMVGSIVGDIDIEETKKLLETYFGKFRGNGKNCKEMEFVENKQTIKKEKTVFFDAEPLLVITFHKPKAPAFDDYIFDLIPEILCKSESSRMQKKLVQEKKIAKRIECFNSFPGTRFDNLFTIYAEPFDVDHLNSLENDIIEELNLLATNTIKADEFERGKNWMKRDFLMSIETNFEIAQMLTHFENVIGDWQYIFKHPDEVNKITLKDIKDTANRYFKPENMTVVKLRRKDG